MLLEDSQNSRRSLRDLPAVEDLTDPPWSLRTTRQAAEMLGVDPCTLSMWRYRQLGPKPEPRFFKGSTQAYRIDRIQGWLAQRQGLTYDQHQAWADGLERINFEPEPDVCDQVQRLVQLLGPEWAQPTGCRWSVGGFAAYLESLFTFLRETFALTSKADTATDGRHVAKVPRADMVRYSITSSALASNAGGTIRPRALAVFILITSSNLVGCSTGRSEGLVPLRTLST
jgi:hypothetical protein